MNDFRALIKEMADNGYSNVEIAEVVYGHSVHQDNSKLAHVHSLGDLAECVISEFGLQQGELLVSGSVQTGFSLLHGQPFKSGVSDLDLAICSEKLYEKMMRAAREASANLTYVPSFPALLGAGQRTSADVRNLFINYLKKGIFRVDLMPKHQIGASFRAFFSNLSEKYHDHFSEISATIYKSRDAFFSSKADGISSYLQSLNVSATHGGITRLTSQSTLSAAKSDDFRDRETEELFQEVNLYVEIAFALTIPVDPAGAINSGLDVMVFYKDGGSVNPVGSLWRIAGRYARKKILVTFVPLDLNLAAVVDLAVKHGFRCQAELGSRSTGAMKVLLPSVDNRKSQNDL